MTYTKEASATEWALRERVKELACLYGIAQLVATPDIALADLLRRIAALLPPAWQYPDVTSARIVLDGVSHATTSFQEGPQRQTTPITVAGHPRGAVEIVYSEIKPERDEGPFLKEERSLIDAVAGQISLAIARREAEEEKERGRREMEHVDRLATLGVLAAGVAHELNEPLAGILGLAQLAGKTTDLSEQARGDILKIEAASLRAREIVRKLLTFSRQMPTERTDVDLNRIARDGLALVSARCAQNRITIRTSLSPHLPGITGDPVQLGQVVLNLAVNAMQAMPDGGQLTVETTPGPEEVRLAVEDNGCGMDESTQARIFLPFFTSKDVGQGTGLGLPVVHGIVTAHGGSIRIRSSPRNGSRFEVTLPLTPPPDAAEATT